MLAIRQQPGYDDGCGIYFDQLRVRTYSLNILFFMKNLRMTRMTEKIKIIFQAN